MEVPPYLAYLLDADDTLFDFGAAEEAAFAAAMGLGAPAGAPASDVAGDVAGDGFGGATVAGRNAAGLFRAFKRVNRRLWALADAGKLDAALIREERFRILYEEEGIEPGDGAPPHGEAAESFIEALGGQSPLVPGAVELLSRIKARGGKVIVATNGYAAVQKRRLARSRLAPLVDGILVSEDAGFRKPDPRYFALCLSELERVGARGAPLMVGDNPSTDVAGAMAAGLDACWMNRRGEAWPAELPAPTWEVRSLEEIG